MVEHSDSTLIKGRQWTGGTVIRACRNCGAGGLFHAVEGVNPGCYDPDRVGQYVGPICPNCGAARPPLEPQGLLNSKEVYPWGVRVWRKGDPPLRHFVFERDFWSWLGSLIWAQLPTRSKQPGG